MLASSTLRFMGIDRQSLQLFLHADTCTPLAGTIVLIGKSTVTISPQQLSLIAYAFNKHLPDSLLNDCSDKQTKHSSYGYSIDDAQLIKYLFPSIHDIAILDVSAYEGADIVADINCHLDPGLHQSADIIYDSSVSDNIFNPAQMYVNIHNMLRPGGLVIAEHHSGFYPGNLASLSPEWFYSFFVCNGYTDVQIYVAVQNCEGLNRFEYTTDLFYYKPDFTYNRLYNRFKAAYNDCGVLFTLVSARKNSASSSQSDRLVNFPINLQYLDSTPGAFRWDSHPILSELPLLEPKTQLKQYILYPPTTLLHSDHYNYLFSGF